MMNNSDIIVIDTETTGLSPYDEILQLSIIDGNGKTLLNELYRPLNHTQWSEAEKVNGITFDMVKDKKCIGDDVERIVSILSKAKKIVGYNVTFDLNMLMTNLAIFSSVQKCEIFDVYRNYKYLASEKKLPVLPKHTLKNVSEFFGFKVPAGEKLHDSLTDVKATLHSYKEILNYM